jgi:hypothetical protein
MKTSILKTAALCGLLAFGFNQKSQAQSFSESFNDITTLAGSGWVMTNASVAVGSTSWFQGSAVGAGGPFTLITVLQMHTSERIIITLVALVQSVTG